MSLEIDFATLAEGVAADARGNFTLVAANPNVLIADQLPVQFIPFFMVVIADNDDAADPVIVPGRTVTGRIEARGPDDEVLFVAQLRQSVQTPNIPSISPRIQILAQVPFTATKTGEFHLSAHIVVVNEQQDIMGEITALRKIRVMDRASLRP